MQSLFSVGLHLSEPWKESSLTTQRPRQGFGVFWLDVLSLLFRYGRSLCPSSGCICLPGLPLHRDARVRWDLNLVTKGNQELSLHLPLLNISSLLCCGYNKERHWILPEELLIFWPWYSVCLLIFGHIKMLIKVILPLLPFLPSLLPSLPPSGDLGSVCGVPGQGS